MLDTIYTLQAMLVDVFVMRDAEPGLPAYVARHVAPHVSVLNAGEAHASHPTQRLLDTLTIRQRKGDLKPLTVAIVGDIRHSRVARSTGTALLALGVGELRLVGPASLSADAGELAGAKRFTTLREGIRGADVVSLDLHSSSRVMGETVLDTIYTLQALLVDVFVMRDAEPGLPAYVAWGDRAAGRR